MPRRKTKQCRISANFGTNGLEPSQHVLPRLNQPRQPRIVLARQVSVQPLYRPKSRVKPRNQLRAVRAIRIMMNHVRTSVLTP